MGIKAKSYKYVGTENDKFLTGAYYTYKEMSLITGLGLTTLRNRMRYVNREENGERYVTDSVLNPSVRKPFTTLDGEKIIYKKQEFLLDRCETRSEQMMNKYLRRAI